MVWFYVDDVLPFHERVLRAGNAAMGLWVRAGAYCSGQLTDGFVTTEVARTMGSPAEIRKLVAVGLWRPEQRDGLDGYQFHAWAEDGTGTKRQPTRAEVESRRKAERDRKAAYRAGRKADQQDTAPPSAPSPPGVPPGQTPDGRAESRQASELPVQSSPVPSQDDYLRQSSHVAERESYPQDDDEDGRTRRDAYWRSLRISNPTRLIALLARHVDRSVTEQQAVQIAAEILTRPKHPPRNPQAYVEGAIAQSWAEIQKQLDDAAVAA